MSVRVLLTAFCMLFAKGTSSPVALDPYEDFAPIDSEARFIDTIFNTTAFTAGLFNNSLINFGITLIVIIILFELALYALDVYYNQTYGYAYNRIDGSEEEKEENVLATQLYSSYPTYYDHYATTYRGMGGNGLDFKAILRMLSVAQELFAESRSSNFESESNICQKRWVCEVYHNPSELGNWTKSAQNFLSMINPVAKLGISESLSNIDKEIQEIKEMEETCGQRYSDCSITLMSVKQRLQSVL